MAAAAAGAVPLAGAVATGAGLAVERQAEAGAAAMVGQKKRAPRPFNPS